MSLSPQEIYQHAVNAGFSHDSAVTMTAIALAESQGDPNAHNPNTGTGDNSYGLWQINMLGSMGPQRRRQLGLGSNNDLFNPETNARAAFQISGGGGNFGPWTTYKTGAYQKYLGQAQAAASGGMAKSLGGGGGPNQGMAAGVGAGAAGSSATPAPTSPQDKEKQIVGALDGFQSAYSSTMANPGSTTGPGSGDGSAASPAAGLAIKAALGAVGVPYQWGGTNMQSGVDCSGLIQQAYKAAGIDLPRVSNDQINAGTPVDPTQMQPGDLLGWAYDKSLKGGATHVAMYIGGGKMVEALHTGLPVHVVDVRTPQFVTRITGSSAMPATNTSQPQFSPDSSPHARLASIMATFSAVGSGQLSSQYGNQGASQGANQGANQGAMQ